MDITFNSKGHELTHLKDIKPGELFRCINSFSVYMKEVSESGRSAVNLETGEALFFSEWLEVIRLKQIKSLEVEDYV